MKSLVYVLFVFLFYNCRTKNPSISYRDYEIGGDVYIIEKYISSNGEISTERLLNSDSVPDGFFRKYENGRVAIIGSYLEGKKDSTWVFFDMVGDTVAVENWFSGSKFGKQLMFYLKPYSQKEKSPLYTFSFLNIEGAEIFRAEFDLEGRLKNLDGAPLYYAYNKSRLSVGDTFELIVFFESPSGYECDLTLDEYDENGLIIQSQSISNNTSSLIVLPYAKKKVVEKHYIHPGEYKWIATISIRDSEGKVILKRSSELSLIVDP